ncbi:hypothetical protein J2X69_002006 [Algoriphagus sp. 4150]|uniref:hypothetical protein n=1 Tax=Algoriphagus sp. 4150 TaxID=2817756 RepID=UPI002857B09A|nr:hypothetical protein [Algoriphagus sp. 4150]MDR7129661.1 hypothetical protein [Algoriphagus sp. 4150]
MNKTNSIWTFSVMGALLILLTCFSCSGSIEKKLIGTWEGSDHLFIRTAGPDLVITVNGGIQQHLNSKLILNEDGTYEKLVGEYDNGKGTWKLEDGQLITQVADGNEVVYKLLKITERELIIQEDVTLETPKGELVGKITLTYSK